MVRGSSQFRPAAPAVTLIEVADSGKAYLRKRRTAPDSMPRPANASRARSPPPLSLLAVPLVEVVEPLLLVVVVLVVSLDVLDVLGEAVVSPEVLGVDVLGEAEPLGWLIEPLLFELSGVEVLGVWFAEPVVPPEFGVEVLGVELGVWAGFDVSVVDGVCEGVCAGVELSVEDGVCVAGACEFVGCCDISGVLVLGVWFDGVCCCVCVVLCVVVVLEVSWASIIMLNVRTSAMINKAFFMLFSMVEKVMGPSEKLFQRCSAQSPSAPSSVDCSDALALKRVGCVEHGFRRKVSPYFCANARSFGAPGSSNQAESGVRRL